jgi:hypothetical protein
MPDLRKRPLVSPASRFLLGKSVADFATSAGRCSSCWDCQRAAYRLASRRRAAAMRLLIAAHPEEWAGLLGLVRGRRHLGTNWPKRGGRDAA